MDTEFFSKMQNIHSFVELQSIFESWINEGVINEKSSELQIGYTSLITYPSIYLTKDNAKKEIAAAKNLFLLTTKPVLYVCNVDDASAAEGNHYVEEVREAIKSEDAQLLIISAQTEADIAELESYEEKQMFLEDMGLKESGCNRLIKSIYSLLNLQTFITAGEMEVKAWTFRKGWKAPQCAGVIHTDFEKGFIRAEVIKYEDYIKYGSEAAVREAGKMGVEGKDYVVQDGDIMHFRFNV
jgi:GTP-binding protein YchF